MLTPFQPVGPYFHVMLDGLGRVARLAGEGAHGQRITIGGVLRDGAGKPVRDGMIEIWHADAGGRYRHPADPRSEDGDTHFWGYGRVDTDDEGAYRFETIRPGAVPAGNGAPQQAPHVLVSVYAPGILTRLFTRLYFADEPANETDPVLRLVPAHRRHTLLTTLSTGPGADASATLRAGPSTMLRAGPSTMLRAGPSTMLRAGVCYRFDIVLQGADETVFFAA